jgi:hypothetical protein
MSTFLGLVAAGIAVALKDPLTNLAGWLFILWRRPFTAGDRVQIGEHKGDVIDLRLFRFTLLEIGNWVHADQSTGRLLQADPFRYRQHARRSSQRNRRTPDPRRFAQLHDLLLDPQPTVYTSVVLLTIRYLCQARQRRDTTQAIWEAILDEFANNASIDFAYPTTRFFDHAAEGKKPLRPPPD